MPATPGSSSNSTRTNPRTSVHTSSTGADGGNSSLRAPRSLPPWIDSYDVSYGSPATDQFEILNQPPPRARAPQHNSNPTPPQRKIRRVSKDGYVEWEDDDVPQPESPPTNGARKAKLPEILKRRGGAGRGRKWDHLRSADPVVVSGYVASNANPAWRNFLQSSQYGHSLNEKSRIVDAEMLDELQPGFSRSGDLPRPPDSNRTRSVRKHTALSRRIWRIIIRHPLVPLAFRLGVLATSIVALALAVHELPRHRTDIQNREVKVALVIDCIAIPYICYMTFDEYTGKPLGLRAATQKSAFVLMDLLFIILKSSSATLAFESLESLTPDSDPNKIAVYRTLAAFLLLGLISWTLTFTVNVFRLVQRLGGGEAEEENNHSWRGHGQVRYIA